MEHTTHTDFTDITLFMFRLKKATATQRGLQVMRNSYFEFLKYFKYGKDKFLL